MKKCFVAVFCIIFFLLSTTWVSAEKGFSEQDINNIANQEKSELLQLQGFSEEDIDKMSDYIKNDLLRNGGEKVEVEIEVQKNIVDSNGKKLSGDKISPYLVFEEQVDDKFFGSFVIANTGETSNHYIYTVYNEYAYTDRINFTFTDRIANSWQVELTPRSNNKPTVESFALAMIDGNISDRSPYNVWEFNSELYGIEGSYDVGKHSSQSFGFDYELVAHKDNSTHRTGIQAVFIHPWTPSFFNFTFNKGVIQYDGSGLYDEWRFQLHFNIGE